jgi:hypothetical protein
MRQAMQRRTAMTRKLKILNLALLALCVVGIVSASGAQAQKLTGGTDTKAEDGFFKIDSKTVSMESFDAFGTSIQCEEGEYEGTETDGEVEHTVHLPTEAITLEAHYSKCTGPSGFPTKVTTNGCHYVMDGFSAGEENTFTSKLDIECPAGKAIEIDVWFSDSETEKTPKCIVKVPTQTGLGEFLDKVDVPNATERAAGKRDDITFEGTISSVKATQTRNSFLCPTGTETNEGKLTIPNTITVQATEDKGKKPLVDFWFD